MARISVSIAHRLGREEAKRRLLQHVSSLQARYPSSVSDVRQHWTEQGCTFSLRVAGSEVSGTVQIGQQFVRVEVELPWFMGFWAGRVRREIEQRGRQALGS